MVSDERWHELEVIAAQLVGRVGDEPPEEVGEWLASVAPSSTDWWQLCFVLAAAVPTDKPFRHLTAWTRLTPIDNERAELIAHRQARLTGRPAA